MDYSQKAIELSQYLSETNFFFNFKGYSGLSDVSQQLRCSEDISTKSLVPELDFSHLQNSQLSYGGLSANLRATNNQMHNIMSDISMASNKSNDFSRYNAFDKCYARKNSFNDCSSSIRMSPSFESSKMEAIDVNSTDDLFDIESSKWHNYNYNLDEAGNFLSPSKYDMDDFHSQSLSTPDVNGRNSILNYFDESNDTLQFNDSIDIFKANISQDKNIYSSLKKSGYVDDTHLSDIAYMNLLNDKYSEKAYNHSDCVSTANSLNCYSIGNHRNTSVIDDTSSFSPDSILGLSKDKLSPSYLSNWGNLNCDYGNLSTVQNQIKKIFPSTNEYSMMQSSESLHLLNPVELNNFSANFSDKSKDSIISKFSLFPLDYKMYKENNLETLHNQNNNISNTSKSQTGLPPEELYVLDSNSSKSMKVPNLTFKNNQENQTYSSFENNNKRVDSNAIHLSTLCEQSKNSQTLANDVVSNISNPGIASVAGSAQLTLIVNVPPTTTRQDLLNAFKVFGQVIMPTVVCRRETRHPKKEWTATAGYAFVLFESKRVARSALEAAEAGSVVIRGFNVKATWAKKDSFRTKDGNVLNMVDDSVSNISELQKKKNYSKMMEKKGKNDQFQCWESDLQLISNSSESININRNTNIPPPKSKNFASIYDNRNDGTLGFPFSPNNHDVKKNYRDSYNAQYYNESDSRIDKRNNDLLFLMNSFESPTNTVTTIKSNNPPKKKQWKSQYTPSNDFFISHSLLKRNTESIQNNSFLKPSISREQKTKISKRFFVKS